MDFVSNNTQLREVFVLVLNFLLEKFFNLSNTFLPLSPSGLKILLHHGTTMRYRIFLFKLLPLVTFSHYDAGEVTEKKAEKLSFQQPRKQRSS